MPPWGGLAGGFSLLGDRQIRVAGGDGPEIQVKVYGLFSEVKVTDQVWGTLKTCAFLGVGRVGVAALL